MLCVREEGFFFFDLQISHSMVAIEVVRFVFDVGMWNIILEGIDYELFVKPILG